MTLLEHLILDGADRVGQFGPIWPGFENDPAGAIEKLIAESDGEVLQAYKHPIIGWIGLVYGNEKMGLRHIAEKRGWDFVRRLPAVLRKGRLLKDPKLPKFYLVEPGSPASVAVVRLDFDGQSKTWIVTMYRDTDGDFATLDEVGRGRTSHAPPVPPAPIIPAGTLGAEYTALSEKQANACEQVLDKVTPIQRIALLRSLGEALTELRNAAGPLKKVAAAKSVAAALAALGAQGPRPGLYIDMADVEGSLESMTRYVSGGLGHIPDALRASEVRMIATLATALGGRDAASRVLQGSTTPVGRSDEAKVAAFRIIADRGVPVPAELAGLQERIADRDAALAAYVKERKEVIDRVNTQLGSLNSSFTALQKSAYAKMRAARAADNDDEYQQVLDGFNEAAEKYRAEFNAVKEEAVKAQAEINRPPPNATDVDLAAEGQAVIAAVLSSSKISEADAKAWASRQTVTPQCVTYLKRQGYTEAALRSDMADFYRMSGGKIAEIEVGVAGRGRAHASGISAATGRKFIGAGNSFNRTILFHELAHHIEADEIAKTAANGFLISRRKAATPVSLARLTGNRGYGAGEVAYEDNFIHPYIGKVYSDNVTEVYSMGVQYLATPADAAMFAAKDPEMFSLVTGYLAGALTPAMQGLISLHTGVTDARREDETKTANEYVDALRRLAAGVNLGGTEVPKHLAEDSRFLRSVASHAKRGSSPKYLGTSDGHHHVFEGVFKDNNTKRYAKGHLVAYDTGGLPELAAVHVGLDGAKALITLSRRDGQGLWRAAHDYFWSYKGLSDTRKILIEAAQGVAA